MGAGYLGAAIARALPVPVIAISRSGRWREGSQPPGATLHAMDLCDPALDPGPLREAQAMVIAVAPGRTQDRRALYVDGPRRLLERVGAGRLRRLVWVGSTSALPDRDAWLDERCTEPPGHERGRLQREAEASIVEHAERHQIPWLVLRLGGLYGPGRALSRIYRRRHQDPLPGDGMAPTNLVHRDDAVAAVCAALAAPPELQGVIHVVDDDHVPRRCMYARLAALTGQPPVGWAEPAPPGAVPRGKRVSNRRLKHWLGVRLAFPEHRLDDECGG
ncbi:MAG: NAD-dependent epimerase/dehydratase family protein [Myxococcales bacterium]|nr:NAD-dependent epimerase/dehydratase family protein [Myxococcales bacterium]